MSINKIFTLLLFLLIVISTTNSFLTYYFFDFFHFFDDFVILVLSLFIFLIGLYTRKINCPFKKPLITLIFFIVLSSLINISNISMQSFLFQIKGYFFCFILLPVLYFFIKLNHQHKIVNFYIIFFLILSIFGIYEFITQSHYWPNLNKYENHSFVEPFRSFSLVGHPNDYAFSLLFPIYYLSCYFFHKNKINYKYLIILFILLTGLLFSLSVGAFFALLTSFSFYLIAEKKVNFKALIIIGITCLLFFSISFDRFILRLNSLFYDSDGASRIYFYKQTYPIISDNFMFGVGIGNFGGHFSDKNNQIYSKYDVDMFGMNSIDSFYPQLLTECGILFFLAYIYFLIKIFLYNRKIVSNSYDEFTKLLAISSNLFLISLFISGFFSMNLQSNMHMITFMILSSCTYYNYRRLS